MKKFILTLILAAVAFSGCNKLEIDNESILGTWSEEYSAYPYFASEGVVTYTFKADGFVDIHYYDVFAGSHDVTTTYAIGKSDGSVLYIDFPDSDESYKNFNVVKFTKNEMEWQKVGSSFSKGSVGSDFKHLVRCK